MSGFREALDAIVGNNQEPGWLRGLRLSALERFEGAPAPGRNDEEWRRVDVSRVLFQDLAVPSGKSEAPRAGAEFPGGVIFDSLTRAAVHHPQIVRPFLERPGAGGGNKFRDFADALWNGGVFLYVPKNASVQFPVTWFSEPQPAEGPGRRAYLPRTLIVLEENSSATFLCDEFSRGGGEAGWVQALTEAHLAAGARLSYMRAQRWNRETTVLSSFKAVLGRAASLNLLAVENGAALSKSGLDIELAGAGAEARVHGLVKGEGAQHYDQTVLVDHIEPATLSRVLCKTAVKDKSKSMFLGLIRVGKRAQKADAFQSNRNLLLSRDARTDAIPKLEIEADDVRCGHGATVSSVDEEQIYYLTSRGLSRGEAEDMIIEGFYGDLLDQSGILGDWLSSLKRNRVLPEENAEILHWVRRVLFARDPHAPSLSLLQRP